MQNFLSNIIIAPLVTGLALTVAFTSLVSSAGADSRSGKATKAEQIEFEQIAPFVQMGGAWGDRTKSAHGTFGRFPGGATSPLHTHGGDYHAVVVSGVMINPFDDEPNPPEMKAGSYWYVPAGSRHVTACISKEPCLFYFHADAAFDFAPVSQ